MSEYKGLVLFAYDGWEVNVIAHDFPPEVAVFFDRYKIEEAIESKRNDFPVGVACIAATIHIKIFSQRGDCGCDHDYEDFHYAQFGKPLLVLPADDLLKQAKMKVTK